MLLAAGREVVSKTSAYNITKLSYRVCDVNTRSCGLGIIALGIFCGLMNLPPPIANNNYQKVSKKLRETARDLAESSMLSAVKLKKIKVHTSVCR